MSGQSSHDNSEYVGNYHMSRRRTGGGEKRFSKRITPLDRAQTGSAVRESAFTETPEIQSPILQMSLLRAFQKHHSDFAREPQLHMG